MIRVSQSVIGAEEQRAVQRVLERGFLGMGPEVAAFEAELALFLDSPVICTNTGTSAIQLALQAVGVGPKDEVLVPSITYVATLQAIQATGATPVVCDVDPHTGLLSCADAKRRLSPKTKALLPVHYAGNMTARRDTLTLANTHGLFLIEDAAHAFGCTLDDEHVPKSDNVAVCYSFDGIKNITSGEGGAVASRNQDILENVRTGRVLGIEHTATGIDVNTPGWRYHMSDLMAAIGRVQLQKFPGTLGPRRRELARLYMNHLPPKATAMLPSPLPKNLTPHIFPIRVPQRDHVRHFLSQKEIQTGFHYPPNHTLSLWRTTYPCPCAEDLAKHQLTLPLHPALKDHEVLEICDLLHQVLST